MFRPAALTLRFYLLLSGFLTGFCWAEPQAVRIAVLENSPPMSYRDSNGKLTGFTYSIAQALCEEMRMRCDFQVTTLDRIVESLARNELDVGAVSLLDTPERRAKVLLTKPYFRSISLWFAKPGIPPGHVGVHVAVVKGSAQERYARQQNWPVVAVPTNGQLAEPLIAGLAQAAIIPMSTALNIQKDKAFLQLGFASTVMQAPELGGDASFGVNPLRPDLKEALDEALYRIKRNGVYDRINTQFLPFRIN